MIVFATEVNDCVNFDHLPRKCPTTTVPTMLLILLVLTLSSMQGFRYPLYKNSFESSIFTRLPCSRTCAAVLPTMGAPDMKYLYTIHNSAVPVESAVAFIQSWAYTQAQTGSIISANVRTMMFVAAKQIVHNSFLFFTLCIHRTVLVASLSFCGHRQTSLSLK